MELGTQRNKENFVLTLIRLGFLKIVSLGGRGGGGGEWVNLAPLFIFQEELI